jgi:serine/threonine protein kinase
VPAVAGYEILGELGRGGMGVVYQARHQRLDRIVALKVIRPERLAHSDAVSRFQREARMASRLVHPNLVTVYDADEVDGLHFLAMEYVEGTDLARLVRDQGPLPIALACDYIRQAAQGLQHAHECGLVHRDVKPANLLVTAREGRVKVLDLGLALLREPEGNHPTTGELTSTGILMGTPDFIAPEQVRDFHRVDVRADLYSLGCSFYYLLAGRVPFPGGTLIEKLDKHRFDSPQPVEQLRPEVPAALAEVVRRLMAKRPEDRYQLPAELAAALEPYCRLEGRDSAPLIRELPTPMRPPQQPTQQPAGSVATERRPPRAALRRLMPWLAGVSGFLLVVVLLGFVAGRFLEPRQPNGVVAEPGAKSSQLQGPGDQKPVEKRAADQHAADQKPPEGKSLPKPPPPKLDRGDLKILFSADPSGTSEPALNLLYLRPNTSQSFYLFVRNQSQKSGEATVVLRVNGQPLEGGVQKISVKPGAVQRVTFGQPLPGKEDKPPILSELKGPLLVSVVDDKNEPLADPSPVSVAHPRQYVAAGCIFDPGENRLEVRVTKTANFIGDRSQVELDLRPDRIPALVEGQKKSGTYSGYLTDKNKEVKLVAENLQFKPGVDRTGLVYLRIDGYERAITFYATFASNGLTQLNQITDQPILRINADRVTAASPAAKVGVEIDNIREGQVAELGLFRSDAFKEQEGESLTFIGDRRVRLFFNPTGPDGALLFRTEVQDWSAGLDVKDVFGQRVLRLRLLANDKEEKVIDSSEKVEPQEPARDKFKEKPFVRFSYLVDGSPPEGVKFVLERLPATRKEGDPLRVVATGQDPESGIKEVIFFVGKPDKDGNPPPNAVQAEGRPVAKEDNTWAAELAAPTDKKSILEVSVLFINGVGLRKIETITVDLSDPTKPVYKK